MELKYIFSLFIIYSLILSVLLESTDLVTNKSGEDDDDYDYEDEITPTVVATSSTARPTRRKTPPPTQMYFPDLDDVRPINPCPENCACNKFLKLVNCSSLELTEIPARIPQDTRIIDLSHNSINEIKATDFTNCSDIQEVNLAYNKISGLSQGVLKNIANVNKLNVSHNELPKLNMTTFTNMLFLRTLDLSYNPIVVATNDQELIWAENLNELLIEGCTITNFHDNSFRKLEKLTLLNIKNNKIIDDELNVETFRPLKMLSTLQITNITQNKTEELCKILETVDKIETKNFTISCFELMAGSKFEDSVITIKLSTTTEKNRIRVKNPKFNQQNVYSQVNNASNDITTPSTVPVVTESPVVTTVNNEVASSNNATIKENDPSSQNTTITSNEPVKASSDYINHILIGIIVVCCIGLIIGLICRSDVCGIKTKCCRTKRPRNENHHGGATTAEEVPLNKVVTTTT